MDRYTSLQSKKQELEQLISKKRESLQIPVTESTDELSMYDQHPADVASDLYEREKDAGLLELLEMELEKVNDALDKYQNGQYGICQNCGRPIEPARLERLVNTTVCANCAHNNPIQFYRPAEEDITSPGNMSDIGEQIPIAGYDFYDE